MRNLGSLALCNISKILQFRRPADVKNPWKRKKEKTKILQFRWYFGFHRQKEQQFYYFTVTLGHANQKNSRERKQKIEILLFRALRTLEKRNSRKFYKACVIFGPLRLRKKRISFLTTSTLFMNAQIRKINEIIIEWPLGFLLFLRISDPPDSREIKLI